MTFLNIYSSLLWIMWYFFCFSFLLSKPYNRGCSFFVAYIYSLISFYEYPLP